jgi:molybdopterin-guanine dinucleotide biosynthesis protein A
MPLVSRAIAAAAAVCGSVSLVGDPKKYSGLGFPVIADTVRDLGPVAGIEAALAAATADWNLVLACDMPALDPAILERLFAEPAEPLTDCVMPKYPDGQVEPLCAVYHRRCHAQIRAALEKRILKITAALEGLAIRYVPVSRGDPFTNLNTPEDVRRYRNG